ncbi:MAG: hypothetical protein M1838_005214 [Thelocarpon superellum]|nr:MAG: hypothetical protein M1838_005214 [Thelocarpon superellum]
MPHQLQVYDHHRGRVKLITWDGSEKFYESTIRKYLPMLWTRLVQVDRHRHLVEDLTQYDVCMDEIGRRCLARLLHYLIDLETSGGHSTVLIEYLAKAFQQSLLTFEDSRYSQGMMKITRTFYTFGTMFDHRHFGCNRTIYSAMEGFFMQRSRELCQLLAPQELMVYLTTLDGMRGPMDNVIAALKLSLGAGPRMQALLDLTRSYPAYLHPETIEALHYSATDGYGKMALLPYNHRGALTRYGDPRMTSDMGVGRGTIGRLGGRDHDRTLIPRSFLPAHMRINGHRYRYSQNAPSGYVYAIPRSSAHHDGLDESNRLFRGGRHLSSSLGAPVAHGTRFQDEASDSEGLGRPLSALPLGERHHHRGSRGLDDGAYDDYPAHAASSLSYENTSRGRSSMRAQPSHTRAPFMSQARHTLDGTIESQPFTQQPVGYSSGSGHEPGHGYGQGYGHGYGQGRGRGHRRSLSYSDLESFATGVLDDVTPRLMRRGSDPLYYHD